MIRYHSLQRRVRDLILLTGDSLIAALLLSLIVLARRTVPIPGTEGLLPAEKFPLDALNLGAAAATLVISLALNGFYSARVTSRHRPLIAAAMLMQVAMLAILSTVLERPYPRTVLFALPLLEAPMLLGLRRLLRLFERRTVRSVLLVGEPAEADAFLGRMDGEAMGNVRFAGLVSTAETATGTSTLASAGRLADPSAEETLRRAEEVICLSTREEDRLRLLEIRGPFGYLIVPGAGDALIASAKFGWIADQPLIEVTARGSFGAGAVVKRVVDLLISALVLVVALPLLVAITAVVAIDSGRPVLLWQRRVGRSGRTFAMAKFRTLREGAPPGPVRSNDERVTRAGRWLRRHRLDELPQLVNVLRGDMSLVGPRPERPEAHENLAKVVRGFGLRLLVRPGVTGLAQISSEYESEAATKLRYDLTYICAWSLRLDFWILAQSVSTALSGRGL